MGDIISMKNKSILTVVILIILAVFFMWVFVWPAIVKKQCLNKVYEQIAKEFIKHRNMSFPEKWQNNVYRNCLIDHFVKPENLISQ